MMIPFVLDQHAQKLDSEPKSFSSMREAQMWIAEMPNPRTKRKTQTVKHNGRIFFLNFKQKKIFKLSSPFRSVKR